jgi:hypothetical protein
VFDVVEAGVRTEAVSHLNSRERMIDESDITFIGVLQLFEKMLIQLFVRLCQPGLVFSGPADLHGHPQAAQPSLPCHVRCWAWFGYIHNAATSTQVQQTFSSPYSSGI